MKRFTVFFVAFVSLSCAALFAAPKPSIDGRAVVADLGVLPKGPYGKSIGFLPGDSVTVTNPAAGVSVDVMILGALDSSEGIAILLSPEAADSLFIAKDSQSLVTITKKGTAADTPPAGQSRSAGSSNRAATAAAKTDPDTDAYKALPAGIAEKFGDTSAADTRAQIERPAAASASGGIPESEPAAARAAEVGSDNGIDWNSFVYDEPLPEIASNTGIFNTDLLPPSSSAEIAQSAPSPVQPEPPSSSSSAAQLEPEPPPVAASVQPEQEPAAPVPQDNLDSIVLLIPADPRPPVSRGNTGVSSGAAQPAQPTQPEPSDTQPSKPAQPEPSAALPPKPVEPESITVQPPSPVEPEPSAAAKPENPVPIAWAPPESAQRVMRIQSLERGKYYVQIATFSNPESVKTVAAKYGDKYPLVQIVNDAAASSQILVGPLGSDEYGAVLARFKAYGYSDAFLRTGK